MRIAIASLLVWTAAAQPEPAPAGQPRPKVDSRELAESIRENIRAEIAQSIVHGADGLTARVTRAARVEVRNRVGAALAQSWDNSSYSQGTAALHRSEWDKAAAAFEKVIQSKRGRVDGALYWKALALHKLGKKDEAMAALAALAKDHPQSRWLGEAKALELEVRQSSGQPVSPEALANEDLKLYALGGLVHTEPERAMPLLEKALTGSSSPRVRARALVVLAEMKHPRAKELLTNIAQGQGNPDLQHQAVRYLGRSRDKEALPLLDRVYAASQDREVRREVLRSYAHHKDKERLLAALKSETDPGLRSETVHHVAHVGGRDELWTMYESAAPEVKMEILRSMHGKDSIAKLLDVAKREKDAKLRREAIRMMRHSGAPTAASSLVELARAESDATVKKEIIRELSEMKSKEASDYLVELLSQ